MTETTLVLPTDDMPTNANARDATISAMHRFLDTAGIDNGPIRSRRLNGGRSNLYLALHNFDSCDVVQKTVRRPDEIEKQKYAYSLCSNDVIIPRVLSEKYDKEYSSFLMEYVPFDRMSSQKWLENADKTASSLAHLGVRTARSDNNVPPLDFLPASLQTQAASRINHEWRVLVHNDVTRNNAGFIENRLILIDWGEASIGLPGADLWMFESWDAVSEEQNERIASLYAHTIGHGLSIGDVRFASILNGIRRMHRGVNKKRKRKSTKRERFIDLYGLLCRKLQRYI